jgi:hypothetical protein
MIVFIFVRYFSYWKFDVIYRVRLEKGDDGKQRGGKSEKTADIQQVTTLYNNATLSETSVNNTGRAKQSSPVGDSIKSLANQLLGSHYFEKDSDESERDSDEDISDSMVDEDVRTPPKLKAQVKHKQNNQHVKLSPKTTEIPVHEHRNDDTEEEMNHKGIAVPVIIEDDDDVEETIEKLTHARPIITRQTATAATQKKKPTTTMTTSKPYYETTSSDGVSTWVLLSGSSPPTTPSHLQNKGKTNKTPTSGNHKATHTTPTAELLKTAHSSEATQVSNQGFGGGFGPSTIEPYYYQGGLGGSRPFVSTVGPTISTRKPVGIGSLSSQAHTPAGKPNLYQNETLELLKLTKTRKPNPTRATTVKTKVVSTTPTTTTPIPSSATKRHPVNQQNNNQKTQLRVTTVSPIVMTTNTHKDTEEPLRHSATVTTTENEIVSSEENEMEESNTDATVETTTKRPRRPTGGNKKRKKNKNRRRRPTNRPEVTEDPESKTGDLNATSTNNNVATKERPLSTRIYNYLAREVMPSVGVGLIGLVVTAGLAGLIMYPFGGGLVTRRTYEEVSPHHMNPNAYYHNGEYDGEIDNSQSEEEVFGKLLEGMNDKGEFTYGEIGEDTAGYAGVPGIGGDQANEQGSRYKTGDASRGDMHSYSPAGEAMHETHQGVRYGGGVEGVTNQHTGVRYDSSQQGTASYNGENKAVQPFSHGSQQNYGSSFGVGNTQDRYQYEGMATRSGEIGDSVRDSQPLYSGTVNAAKKQYTAGNVHVNSNTNHHVITETTAYGGPYYTPSYVESQPYTRNVYGGLTAVGGQTYGTVQVDSKSGRYHSGSTEQSLETEHKTESNSAGNLQYRRGVSESSKEYRDFIGTQPRSGGTIIAVSVARQPGLQGKERETETKQSGERELIENISKAEGSSSQRTYETHKNQMIEHRNAGSHDSDMEYGGMLDISSRISPELQKRGSIISGIVEHGPRTLRRRRDANVSRNLKVSDEDIRDNEIDSTNLTGNVGQSQIQNLLDHEENSVSTHFMPKNVVALSDDKQISGATEKQNVESKITETETSTINGEDTTGPIKDTRNVGQGTASPTESTTLEDILPTTAEFNNDDTNGEGADIEEEDAEYETTISPEITTVSDETSTKDLQMETTTKIPEAEFSLLGLFQRIARFKLRMGLNLLKSTSQALTNYIEGVQKRMDKNYNSSNVRSIRARSFKRGT